MVRQSVSNLVLVANKPPHVVFERKRKSVLHKRCCSYYQLTKSSLCFPSLDVVGHVDLQ